MFPSDGVSESSITFDLEGPEGKDKWKMQLLLITREHLIVALGAYWHNVPLRMGFQDPPCL